MLLMRYSSELAAQKLEQTLIIFEGIFKVSKEICLEARS